MTWAQIIGLILGMAGGYWAFVIAYAQLALWWDALRAPWRALGKADSKKPAS